MKTFTLIVLSQVICAISLYGQETIKNIVLIAGMKSHGDEGNGIHDYPWDARLLKASLETSNIREDVSVSMHLNGWPLNATALEDADTIVILSDGRDGDAGREALHIESSERVKTTRSLMERGCGLVVVHFATFAPDRLGDEVLDWVGGYFDWETGGRRQWTSQIETVEARMTPASPEHPILTDVRPFTLEEEFYFDMHFRENDPRWTPIWEVDTLPAKKPRGKVVAWALQRKDGGRSFATTCGHFHENFKLDDYRKTFLNALAWTAHVPIPDEGVKADFLTRNAIARHLGQPDLVKEENASADETVYQDAPYWYKPGHPIDPAEPAAITTLPGFVAEKVYTVPEEFGSWTALGIDNHGRLLAAAQHKEGIYRLQIEGNDVKVERLRGEAEHFGFSHGLLYAFDSLYVTVSEDNEHFAAGVYRLQDLDNDDQYDTSRQLVELRASGEHGPHNIVAGPGGDYLYMICGNGTPLPEVVTTRRPVSTDGIDHLMPPGFESSKHTVAGWVCRFKPDGTGWELMASGLRNSFDLAFNEHGDLFTFDSDMEWDLGAPWYRPTRICHLVSGAEFGWRPDAAKWPAHFEDSVGAVVNIGPGSPTGIAFAYGAKFPDKYRRALFACDWTFGTIHAIHFTPDGAGYAGEVEEFLGGNGLPITDVVIGKDGAMYFAVGGRRLGSAIYRVRYTGGDIAGDDASVDSSAAPSRATRRALEVLHHQPAPADWEKIWQNIAHPDRALRFAARVALERQPVSAWREKALRFSEPGIQLSVLLALARQDDPANQPGVVERLNQLDFGQLEVDKQLRALRVYELALARGQDAVNSALRTEVITKLRQHFPSEDTQLNRELARILFYLGDAASIDRALGLMESNTGELPALASGYFVRNPKYGKAVRDILQSPPLADRMHYAQMLLWIADGWSPEQRHRYFTLMEDAVAHSAGGHTYAQIWERIWDTALAQVPEDEREPLEKIGNAVTTGRAVQGLPQPEGPGRHWEMEAALHAVTHNFHRRNYANGLKMFSAAQCVLCHRLEGEGSAIGPDLSTLGQRFTPRDILESIIDPSKAVSSQYQMTLIETITGQMFSGRVISRDEQETRLATDAANPTRSISIQTAIIRKETPVPISTMPPGLLNSLNENEMLDLIAYLVAGGNPNHPLFKQADDTSLGN